MHRMIIDIAGALPADLLGLKEAISMVVEGAGRVLRVDVQELVPEQIRMEGKAWKSVRMGAGNWKSPDSRI